MDASPIYAFAVGNSQALFHTFVWLRVSAKRFRWLPANPLKSKKTEPGTRCFSDVRLRRVILDLNMSACGRFCNFRIDCSCYRSCFITVPLSPSMTIERSSICFGHTASL